jgi:hypothetical protein
LRRAASQPPITSPPQHSVSTLRAVARSGGGGCCRHHRPSLLVPRWCDVAISTRSTPASKCSQRWVSGAGLSPPPFSFLPLSLSSPVCTSLPPYKQLLVAEESGAMGIIVSPSFLSSSCPALAVLVLALALASSSPPLPPLPLLARRRRRDGGRPVSTRSTLQARARSGGSRVLG